MVVAARKPQIYPYPRTLPEFNSWFGSEDDCRAYLEKLRWPKGFVCPRCGVSGSPYRIRRDRLRCRLCRAETSVISGTLFADTKLPLLTWFQVIWLTTNQKHGTSALDLKRGSASILRQPGFAFTNCGG